MLRINCRATEMCLVAPLHRKGCGAVGQQTRGLRPCAGPGTGPGAGARRRSISSCSASATGRMRPRGTVEASVGELRRALVGCVVQQLLDASRECAPHRGPNQGMRPQRQECAGIGGHPRGEVPVQPGRPDTSRNPLPRRRGPHCDALVEIVQQDQHRAALAGPPGHCHGPTRGPGREPDPLPANVADALRTARPG
jgi:hypothetical protein